MVAGIAAQPVMDADDSHVGKCLSIVLEIGNLFAITSVGVQFFPGGILMHTRMRIAAQVAASGLALLLSTAEFAAPQDYQYRADRISMEGRITAISQEGDQYRVTLN